MATESKFCQHCAWPDECHVKHEKCYTDAPEKCIVCDGKVTSGSLLCTPTCLRDDLKKYKQDVMEFIASLATSEDAKKKRQAFDTLAFLVVEFFSGIAGEMFRQYFISEIDRHVCSPVCEELLNARDADKALPEVCACTCCRYATLAVHSEVAFYKHKKQQEQEEQEKQKSAS
jgi:predicted nucleic acid-binding Zn ribbon protein